MSITPEQKYHLAMDRALDLQQAIASLSGDAKARDLLAPVKGWIEANLNPALQPTEGEA